MTLSRATIHRILTRHGAITPEPKKRPKLVVLCQVPAHGVGAGVVPVIGEFFA